MSWEVVGPLTLLILPVRRPGRSFSYTSRDDVLTAEPYVVADEVRKVCQLNLRPLKYTDLIDLNLG